MATKTDRGGYNLRASDGFIKRAMLRSRCAWRRRTTTPSGAQKWGASDAITIVPPDVAEPESRRLAALVKVRDQLVDALAWRLATPLPAEPSERREMLEHDTKWSEQISDALDQTLSTTYAGVRVPGRLGAMLRGRMRKMTDATTNQLRSPSTTARANVVKATERMVLVIDGAIRGLGLRDTKDAARELAEVADELAAAASSLAQKTAEDAQRDAHGRGGARPHGRRKAMRLLGASAETSARSSRSISLASIARERRRTTSPHATLAAQGPRASPAHARSFVRREGRSSIARGRRVRRRSRHTGDDGDGSDVEQAFNEAAGDLDKLASEHAGNMGQGRAVYRGGLHEGGPEQLSEEAKKHARVRDATKNPEHRRRQRLVDQQGRGREGAPRADGARSSRATRPTRCRVVATR